jgi:hypothetical protein
MEDMLVHLEKLRTDAAEYITTATGRLTRRNGGYSRRWPST